MEQSPRPKIRPRSKTKRLTVRGRPVWVDHTGEVTGKKGTSYSEVTTTVPWGTGWATLPTIDGQGKRLSDEEVFKRTVQVRNKLSKGGPVDFITGEELPVFSSQEKAVEYAKWRSSTMFNPEAAKKGFPEEFPMQEEPEPKGPIERRAEPYIEKGKDFLDYLTSPNQHGVFNEGGLSSFMNMITSPLTGRYRRQKPSSVKAAEVGIEFTPAGTVFGINDIREELKKENPDYYKVGLMGGAEVIGLIPGLDKVAIDAIRAGAKRFGGTRKIDKTLEALKGPDAESIAAQKILAGPGAKSYDNRALYKAEDLKARGYSPRQIEEITGRVETGSPEDYLGPRPNQKPKSPFKFEIPDKGIIIKENDGYITYLEATEKRPVRVGNLIPTHKKLFEEYPDLKHVAFYIDPELKTGAHFDPSKGSYGSIVVGPEHRGIDNINSSAFRDTFFHELQHAAQHQDALKVGLQQLGGNPTGYTKAITETSRFNQAYKETALAKSPRAIKLRDKMVKLFKEDADGLTLVSSASGDRYSNPKTAKKMAELMRELEAESFKTYMQTASEVEAGAVGLRARPTYGKDQPRLTSEISERKKMETAREYAKTKPDSKTEKLSKKLKSTFETMDDKEVSRYAEGGINFVRYALGIDKELQGFGAMGVKRYSKGGAVDKQMNEIFAGSK